VTLRAQARRSVAPCIVTARWPSRAGVPAGRADGRRAVNARADKSKGGVKLELVLVTRRQDGEWRSRPSVVTQARACSWLVRFRHHEWHGVVAQQRRVRSWSTCRRGSDHANSPSPSPRASKRCSTCTQFPTAVVRAQGRAVLREIFAEAKVTPKRSSDVLQRPLRQTQSRGFLAPTRREAGVDRSRRRRDRLRSPPTLHRVSRVKIAQARRVISPITRAAAQILLPESASSAWTSWASSVRAPASTSGPDRHPEDDSSTRWSAIPGRTSRTPEPSVAESTRSARTARPSTDSGYSYDASRHRRLLSGRQPRRSDAIVRPIKRPASAAAHAVTRAIHFNSWVTIQCVDDDDAILGQKPVAVWPASGAAEVRVPAPKRKRLDLDLRRAGLLSGCSSAASTPDGRGLTLSSA